jgi:hypothetical protein
VGDHCDPGDADGDGYSDQNEARFIGTRADYPCGVEWPSNLFNGAGSANELDLQDVLSFVVPTRRLDTNPPPPPSNYSARWDLVPGPIFPFPKWINITDLTALVNGTTGSPPMFGGQRAYNQMCPQPPLP